MVHRHAALRLRAANALRKPVDNRRLLALQSRQFAVARSSSADSEKITATSSRLILRAAAACRDKSNRQGWTPSYNSDPKASSCGEDSFFIAYEDSPTPTSSLSSNSASVLSLGVADGVGGWNEVGVDPSAVSRALMRCAKEDAEQKGNSGKPLEILKNAYKRMKGDPSVIVGSTTACLLSFLPGQSPSSAASSSGSRSVYHQLHYANVGDSGFVVYRGGDIIFRSAFQSYPNTAPFQLAKIPPKYFTPGNIQTRPDEADCGIVEVKHGDLIVVATDGVWDNYHDTLLDYKPSPASSTRQTGRNRLPWYLGYQLPPLKALLSAALEGIEGMKYMTEEGRRGDGDEIEVYEEKELRQAAVSVIETAMQHNMKPDDITVIVAQVIATA